MTTTDTEVPGPGAYETVDARSKGPVFSMGSPFSTRRADEVPGPGQYDVKPSHSSSGFTMYGKVESPKDSDVPVSCKTLLLVMDD